MSVGGGARLFLAPPLARPVWPACVAQSRGTRARPVLTGIDGKKPGRLGSGELMMTMDRLALWEPALLSLVRSAAGVRGGAADSFERKRRACRARW